MPLYILEISLVHLDGKDVCMGISGPDNRPQQDTIEVRRLDPPKVQNVNGEVLTCEAKQIGDSVIFAGLKTPVNEENLAEARKNAALSDEQKWALLKRAIDAQLDQEQDAAVLELEIIDSLEQASLQAIEKRMKDMMKTQFGLE